MNRISKVLAIVALTACSLAVGKAYLANAATSALPNQAENLPVQPNLQSQKLPQVVAQSRVATYVGSGEISWESDTGTNTLKLRRVNINTSQGKTAVITVTADNGRRYTLTGQITENTESDGGYRVSLTRVSTYQATQANAEGTLIVSRTGEISPDGTLTYSGQKRAFTLSFTPGQDATPASTQETTTPASTEDTSTEGVRGLW